MTSLFFANVLYWVCAGVCDSEKKARGETANSPEARIADFRAKIADRKAETGKEYLSFYFMEANSYEVE